MCVILLVKGIFCRCLSSVLHLWVILTLGFYFSLYDLYIDESEILQSGLICPFMFRGVFMKLFQYLVHVCLSLLHLLDGLVLVLIPPDLLSLILAFISTLC